MALLRFLIGLTPKNSILANLYLGLLILLPVLLSILIIDYDNKIYYLIWGGVYAFTVLGMTINDFFGKKKHESILYTMTFTQMRNDLKFEIENHNSYYGYFGKYKDYYFRVYYNYNTGLTFRYAFREFVIILYYQPTFKTHDDKEHYYKVDTENSERLDKKYSSYNGSRRELRIYPATIVLKKHYTIFTQYNDIKKEIDYLLDFVKKEGLNPIGLDDLKGLDVKSIWGLHPDIELYWKKK